MCPSHVQIERNISVLALYVFVCNAPHSKEDVLIELLAKEEILYSNSSPHVR